MAALPAFSDSGMPALGVSSSRVRAARIRDWARLQGLIAELFPALDEATVGSWLCNQCHSLAVALDADGGVVGLVRLEVRPGDRVTRVSSLGVAQHARGQGYARALLSYCEEVACACGAPSLELELPAEAHDTQAFFRHLGYGPRMKSTPGVMPGRVVWVRRAPVPVWPSWQLRREHGPRVPPAGLQRLALRALYGAWIGGRAS